MLASIYLSLIKPGAYGTVSYQLSRSEYCYICRLCQGCFCLDAILVMFYVNFLHKVCINNPNMEIGGRFFISYVNVNIEDVYKACSVKDPVNIGDVG